MIRWVAWRALMRRNLVYRKRNWVGTLLEIILPVGFMALLLWIKIAFENTDDFEREEVPTSYPGDQDAFTPLSFRDYVTALQANRTCIPLPDSNDDFFISGIPNQGWNWQVPLVKCDSRKCAYAGQDAQPFCRYSIVAVAGNNDNDDRRAQDFKNWIEELYPRVAAKDESGALVYMPFQHDLVQIFDSGQAMDDYVRDSRYGEVEFPEIAMGIVWRGLNDENHFSYSLRQNSTNLNAPEAEWRPAVQTTPDTDVLFDSYAKKDEGVCIPLDGTGSQGTYENSCTGLYIYNGVLTFQRLVGDYILDRTGAKARGKYISEAGVAFVPFPSLPYVESGFYGDIGLFAALLVTLGFLYPVAAMVISITQEKELGLKELMKMMSVTESNIGWAWFANFFGLHGLITASFMTLVSLWLFENSNGFYLWLFWMCTVLSVVVFSMFVATFTSKQTRAVMISLLLFLIGYFLTFAVDFEDGSSGAIAMISLHPVAAFSYGIQEIGRLEDQGTGLKSSTAAETDAKSGYTFNNAIQSLIIDSLLWGILTWYLDRVVEPAYGQALPFWFPLSRSYWFPQTARHALLTETDFLEAEVCSSVPFEPVDAVLERQSRDGENIEIRNLRKAFGKTLAVDGLTLSMFKNQITCLLGHNAAGKTTTLNMLTGVLAPTTGSALVAGKDIRTQVQQVRKDIGICPQHNCLFPQLTVREHVQFFARLKGVYQTMSNAEAEEHIDQSIRDVALMEKRNTLSKNLSGGMKRKLGVAIAFCGGSKVVFLDEPTSGMDPFSRRFTWNVIRQYRQNRCIVLTTHFMDEADILGDRIAIMSHGKLSCVGSPLFLKKKYGVGYKLTIEKFGMQKRESAGDEEEKHSQEPSDDTGDESPGDLKLRQIVGTAVPSAQRLANSSVEMSYQLPMGEASKFSSMFDALDEEVEQGTICSYGVSITTIDEVFQMVARGNTLEKSEFASSVFRLGVEALGDDATQQTCSYTELEKHGLFLRHVGALFNKRSANFKRDKKAWCCTTVLPSLFVLAGLLIMKYAGLDRDLDPVLLTLDEYNEKISTGPRNPIVYNNRSNPHYTCSPGVCAYHVPEMNESLGASQGESYYFCGLESRLDASQNCSSMEYSAFVGNITAAGASPRGAIASNIYTSSKSLVDSWNASAASQYGALFFTHYAKSQLDDGNSYEETVVAKCESDPGDYKDSETCQEYGGVGVVIQYNFTGLHVAPLFQSLADEALVREAIGSTDFTIQCSIDPLPITKGESNYGEADDAYFAWFLLVLSFPFIAGSFAVFVVSERESKAKHLQTVAGVGPTAYWLSTFLWDMLNYQIPLWLTVMLMFAFDVNVFTTTERGVVGGVIVLLSLFGPAAAGFSYCLTFAFSNASICQMVIIVSSFIIGMGGATTVWILTILGEGGDFEDSKSNLLDAANIVTWILRFNPSFCLAKGLYNTIYIEAFDYWEGERTTVWTEPVLLVEVIFLAWESVVYLVLAIFLDKWSANPMARSMCCRPSQPIALALPEDEDVLLEQERVLKGEVADDPIVIDRLTKMYPGGALAVDNVSLSVRPGEVFGLLGVNGAGKTTTLQILTAEIPPTSGDATLAGFSVRDQPEKTRRRIGYCPQFDAHFENMTGREHVELYALIKGVPKASVKEAAASKLAEVGLSANDCDRLSSEYSGGMKRRLSLACALVGQPQIVFLDEATTGVDPVARREIWRVISDMVTTRGLSHGEKPSVILTTHSMEECEALCPRIGIMANGRLRCLGSAQHLKNKFGQGYQIEMKICGLDRADADFVENAGCLYRFLRSPTDNDAQSRTIISEEGAALSIENIFLTFDESISALRSLTNDDYLSTLVGEGSLSGHIVWKDATSPMGVSLDELAAFATTELRMRKVEDFVKELYPDYVLRERQETKCRYEIGIEGVRISSIFSNIEANKDRLRLADYGVSQTSLEQVFNIHAAQAELHKQGREA